MQTEQQTSQDAPGERPFCSFIVPAWNRRDKIRRCIDSCLSQEFKDFEIVVVDDGSDDDTVDVVRSYADPRVRLVALEKNCGVSVARNAGVAACRSEWLIYLDSDDAMLPDGLGTCCELVRTVSPDVGVVAFGYEVDNGLPAPNPYPPAKVLSFREYLDWWLAAKCPDYLPFHRKEVWRQVPHPNSRATEGPMVLRIMSRFKFQFFDKVVAKVYTDADNRYLVESPDARKRPRVNYADALAAHMEGLKDLGPLLKKESPGFYAMELRQAAILHFACRHVWAGIVYSLRYLRRKPLSGKGWAILFSGIISPKFMLALRARNRRR